MASLSEKVARVTTLVEMAVGPEGYLTKDVAEIKDQITRGEKTRRDVDRLKQTQKTQAKILWMVLAVLAPVIIQACM